jgi:hypothetical protein
LQRQHANALAADLDGRGLIKERKVTEDGGHGVATGGEDGSAVPGKVGGLAVGERLPVRE